MVLNFNKHDVLEYYIEMWLSLFFGSTCSCAAVF